MIYMRSASPAIAGTGSTSTCDASRVATTASAAFFKRDFAETTAPSFWFDRFDVTLTSTGRHRRRYRGEHHPLATGDGRA